jgi:tetratricopeptide (TPR) repeat protein
MFDLPPRIVYSSLGHIALVLARGVWTIVLPLLLAGFLSEKTAAATGIGADWLDQRNIEFVKQSSPLALNLLEQGEKLLESGQAAKAISLFEQAAALVPDNALIARRQCEALATLRQPAAAIAACHHAMTSTGRGPGDMLATVHTLLKATSAPTPAQLYEATMLTQTLMRLVANQAFPYVAQCEIAEQQQDWVVVEKCAAQIQQFAPDSKYSRRFQRVARENRPSWFNWTAWHAILAAAAFTLLHALGVSLLTMRNRAKALAPILLISIVGSTIPTPAIAQPIVAPKTEPKQPEALSTWRLNDTDPESSVPTPEQRDSNPLNYGYFIMDVTARAEKAVQRGDHQAAVKYFRALAKAVPNRSIAFTKLCISYQAMGDLKDALESCQTALGREGVTDQDYLRYAQLVVEQKPDFGKGDIADLDAIVQHLRSNLPSNSTADEIECDLGLKVKDRARLERCTHNLATLKPNDQKTLSYQWSLAVMRRDYATANMLLTQLKKTAANPEAIRKMDEITRSVQPFWKRIWNNRWAAIGLFALVLVAGIVTTTIIRRNRQPAPVG